MRLSVKTFYNIIGTLPKLSNHSTIYCKNKVYIFERKKLYVCDFETSEIQDITENIKGQLLNKTWRGTSTLVGYKIYNITIIGTEVFYLDELKYELLDIDLR